MKYGRISVLAKFHVPIYQILKKMTLLEILYTGICSSQEQSRRLVYHCCFELILESLGKNPLAADLR